MSKRTIPTTEEMDGLFTEKDIQNRDKSMLQCRDCSKWTQQERNKDCRPCSNCGSENFDKTFPMSLRTWSPYVKRKPK